MSEKSNWAEANMKLPRLRVVIAHVEEDVSGVRESLYAPLIRDFTNLDVWFGEERTLPGQDRREQLRHAIAKADVLLLCLSSRSVTSQPRTRLKTEILFALQEANRRPASTILLIPVRLEAVNIPPRLRHLASVDVFEEGGLKRLGDSLQARVDFLSQGSLAIKPEHDGGKSGYHGMSSASNSNRKFRAFMRSIPNTSYLLVSLLAGVVATLGFFGMPTYDELMDRLNLGSLSEPSNRDFSSNAKVSTPSPVPSLKLSSSRDPVGQTWTATGAGFEPRERVEIYWDTMGATPISTEIASERGDFSIDVTTPDTTNGIHTVEALGASSGKKAQAQFHVIVSLSKTPLFGSPGTRVTVSLRGFGGDEPIELYWPNASGMRLGTAKTSKNGRGTIVFTIPRTPNGQYDFLVIGLSSGREAWGSVLVREPESTPMPSSSPSATPFPS